MHVVKAGASAQELGRAPGTGDATTHARTARPAWRRRLPRAGAVGTIALWGARGRSPDRVRRRARTPCCAYQHLSRAWTALVTTGACGSGAHIPALNPSRVATLTRSLATTGGSRRVGGGAPPRVRASARARAGRGAPVGCWGTRAGRWAPTDTGGRAATSAAPSQGRPTTTRRPVQPRDADAWGERQPRALGGGCRPGRGGPPAAARRACAASRLETAAGLPLLATGTRGHGGPCGHADTCGRGPRRLGATCCHTRDAIALTPVLWLGVLWTRPNGGRR